MSTGKGVKVEKVATKAAPAKSAAANRPPFTKTELVSYFAEKFELPKVQMKSIFDELAELAAKEAKKGFTIPGIGKLVIREYKARTGRNPRTGEPMKIKARKKLRFSVSAACEKAAGLVKGA